MSATRLLIALALAAASPTLASAITIVSPPAGTHLAPGARVTVVVASDAGESVVSAVAAFNVVASAALAPSAAGRFQGTVEVPVASVGPTVLVASAELAGGRLAIDSVELQVEPGLVRLLTVSTLGRLSRVGQVEPIGVTAAFEDGVGRDVSGAEKGTTYASSDPSVLGVHPGGYLQARARGEAELTVTNRGVSQSIDIVVDVPSPAANRIPIPDPGPDRTVPKNLTVTLDATTSRDPDGDALQYRWEQVDGIRVQLVDETTARPRFHAPYVTGPTIITFALVVRDARGATSFPAPVRITVTP